MSETMADLIAVACVVQGQNRHELNQAPFGQVTARLHRVATENPAEVACSVMIREEQGMCHWSCHIARLKAALDNRCIIEPQPCSVLAVAQSGTIH